MKIETKLGIGDKIFFVFGNPRKNIVVFSAEISKVTLFGQRDGSYHTMYNFVDSVIEVNRGPKIDIKDYVKFGFVYEEDLDTGNSLRNTKGLSGWPTFTSKEKCIKYLRKVTKGEE